MGISYGFEGNEGAGKSLLFNLTRRLLEKTTGFPVLAIREPGGTQLGENEIRPILRNEKYKGLHPLTNTLLYSAGRSEVFFQVETPFLEKNQLGILLKDRTWLSTVALQTVDGADIDYIMNVQKPFMSRPDKFIIIDIPVEETVTRMLAEYRRKDTGREPDWRDKQDIKTLSAIRQNYLNFVVNHPDKCIVFDCFDDPWVKAAEIKLDIFKTFNSVEGTISNAESALILPDFIEEAKVATDDLLEEVRLFSRQGSDFNPYNVNKLREDSDVARKELGYPSREELQKQMHKEWQNLGIEGGMSGREREPR